MTTETIPTTTEQQPTDQLEAASMGAILDSLPLLDHRTRARAIGARFAPRGHYIELEDGDERLYVPLAQRITHIGRGFTADIRFEQSQVSLSHAILVRHGRFIRVLDNRSSNGTFVNGRRVIATNLEDGDVLRLGPVAMRYAVVS
jgi:pSer/pThr/pTyr-binding forkhead associated (FHA) protein